METKKYIRILLNIIIPILAIYIVCVWGPRLLAFFLPFVVGWLIAMIANPLVHVLEKRVKLVRKHGSFVLIVGVLALVVVGLYFLFSWGMRELSLFIRALPELFEMAQAELSLAFSSMGGLLRFFPADADNPLIQIAESFGAAIGDFLQELTTSAGGAVARTLPDILVNTIVILLSAYFFLTEHDRLLQKAWAVLPQSVKKYIRLLKKDVKHVIGGYFMAQFQIMFVVAIVMLVGLWILDVRYRVYLAIGIALLDFLPMFGTGTVLIPWAIVKLFTGEYMFAFGLILLYVVSQAVRQLIQPKIVGDSLGLAPLTTLFLLFIGYRVRGIAGMILAVPIGMLVIKLYEYGMFDSLIANLRLLIKEIGDLRKE